MKKIFVIALYSITLSSSAMAQVVSDTQTVSTDLEKNSSIPFKRWEIGLDVLPLIDKQKDDYGYVLKRNFLTDGGRNAIRMKFLPNIFNGNGLGGASGNNSTINVAIGYEWQRIKNRFGILYGLEPYFKYYNNSASGQTAGSIQLKTTRTNIGISGFVGGRYYIGSHFSVTVESHIVSDFMHISSTNLGSSSGSGTRENGIYLNPIHVFYTSYHF